MSYFSEFGVLEHLSYEDPVPGRPAPNIVA